MSWVNRLLVALMVIGLASTAEGKATAASADTFDTALAPLRERLYVSPTGITPRLLELQARYQNASPRQRARLLVQLSRAQLYAGDAQASLRSGEQIEALGRQQHDAAIVCMGMLARVYALYVSSDVTGSHALAREAARFAATVDDLPLRVQAMLTVGQAEAESGDPAQALRTIRQAVASARSAADSEPLFRALRFLALSEAQAGDFAAALRTTDEMALIAANSAYQERMVVAKATEFTVASSAGQPDRALDALQAKVVLIRALGLDDILLGSLIDLADLNLKRKRFATALKLSGEALRLATAKSSPRFRTAADFKWGPAAIVQTSRFRTTAEFNWGLASIYLGQVSAGKVAVEHALASWYDPDITAVLREYGAALVQAGDAGGAMLVFNRAAELSGADAFKKIYERENKQHEIDALTRQYELRAVELLRQQEQRRFWWLLAAVSALAFIVVAILYGRLRKSSGLLEERNLALYLQGRQDALTGLFNRRYLQDYLMARSQTRDEAGRAAATGGALLLMDVDHFKQLNDRFGHATGDEVLKAVAARLKRQFCDGDVLVRWGGEEFLAFLPNAGAAEAALITARLLAAVSAQSILIGAQAIPVTVSIGFALLPLQFAGQALAWERVLGLADQALYMAKADGRHMAYGVVGISAAAGAVNAIEADLRAAWRDGLVELEKIDGKDAVIASPSLPLIATAA